MSVTTAVLAARQRALIKCWQLTAGQPLEHRFPFHLLYAGGKLRAPLPDKGLVHYYYLPRHIRVYAVIFVQYIATVLYMKGY